MPRARLIIDGYNVIRATPPYRDLAEVDLESARAALVADVAAYAHHTFDATIVFDGGNNPHSDGVPHHTGGIAVIFSRYGMDADSVVEALAQRARDRGVEAEVVTSDAQTQWTVMGGGVARRSAVEFTAELSASREEWSEHSPVGSSRNTIEQRVDPDVREVLSRWSRGQR